MNERKNNDILTAKIDISRVIEKKFKEREKDILKEKSQKVYKLTNTDIEENQIDIKEDIEAYFRTNDILLIARIIAKDYINYFHFQNILECYRYIVNRFLNLLDENCLKIIYDVPNNDEKKKIQIFNQTFVKNNENIIKLN